MERGDPLPWLAVAIEEEAIGLEQLTRQWETYITEQTAWAAGGRGEGIRCWGLFTGGGTPHYFGDLFDKFTHISIN
jgi:hypothetical protein